MDRIYSAARAVAVIYAIAGAFAALPEPALVLLILGGIAALGNSNDDHQRVLMAAIALSICAPMLTAIPNAGEQLKTIFGGLGTAYAGAAIVGITMSLLGRIRSDWA